MTPLEELQAPLEELQAAHKRLSEQRKHSTQGSWWVIASRDGQAEVGAGRRGNDVVADGDMRCSRLPVSARDGDLIVTLHRTIDAQLAILSDSVVQFRGKTVSAATPAVLSLARAINGEAS